MTPESLTVALKHEAARLGFSRAGACPAVTPPETTHLLHWLAAGFAGEMAYMERRAEAYQHPRHVLKGVRSILMLACTYRTVEPNAPAPGQGRISRYAWGTDYHTVLRQRLRRLAEWHLRLTPWARVRGVVDTAPLLERAFGRLAGLGWIGKNTLLINREHGSWFFLAALLTTEVLQYDPPHEKGYCGTCQACLQACPTGALVAPYQLDARKCISYLTIELRGTLPVEHRLALGDRLFGCDVCQEVCPWNRAARRAGPVKPACTANDQPFWPKPWANPAALPELFALDEAAFGERFRHTALWRAKRGGLLRNAAIVLGNRPHPTGVAALRQGLHDAEPVVRAACAWALGQYPRETATWALKARLPVESDPVVRHEIASALSALHDPVV